MGNLVENEFSFGGGGLNYDVAEGENGFDQSVDMDRDVLDSVGVELGGLAFEEMMLLSLNDALVGDDDGVEHVEGQEIEGEKPENEIPEASQEAEEASQPRFVKHISEAQPNCRRDEEEEEDEEEGNEYGNRVFPDNEQHGLTRLLTLEALGGFLEEGNKFLNHFSIVLKSKFTKNATLIPKRATLPRRHIIANRFGTTPIPKRVR